jgi:hypothetical protein
MLKDGDVFKIKQKSQYQEERKEWIVPHFIISEKKQDVAFPTINGKSRVD